MPLAESVGGWLIAHSPMSGVVVAAVLWGLALVVGGYLRQVRSRAPRATPARCRRAREVVAQHYHHEALRRRRERRVDDVYDPVAHQYAEAQRWREGRRP